MSAGTDHQIWRDPSRDEIEVAASLILTNESGDMPHADRQPSSWRWVFDGAELESPKLTFVHDYWQRLRGDRVAPQASEIDPIDLKPSLGFVLLLDILDDGFDACYRLYGTGVSEKAGRDWTGARVSEMNRIVRTDMALFYRATYLAAFRRQEPLFTLHASPRWLPTEAWRRVLLPLTDASGKVVRFMVGNVPVGWQPLGNKEVEEQRTRLFSSDFSKV